MLNAKLKDPNPLYDEDGVFYDYADIKYFRNYAPYAQTILLAVGVSYYYNHLYTDIEPANAIIGFEIACEQPACEEVAEGFCDLCGYSR